MSSSDTVIISPSMAWKQPRPGGGLAALEAISDMILACHDRESMAVVFRTLQDMLGVANIVYHGVRFSSGPLADPYLVLTYDPAWVTRYIEQDYFRVDPIVQAGARQILPFDWSEARRGLEGARTTAMFAEAERYAVGRKGLSIPIRGPNGERSIFSLTSNASEDEWRQYRAMALRFLIEIGQYIHDRVAVLTGSRQVEAPRLSRREQQCLQMITYGKLPKEISYSLGLSQSAIRTYLHSARHKLGSATLYQAIGRAVAHGLVKP